MARYDYRCNDGHVFEVEHPMAEEPEVTCKCGLRGRKTITETPFFFCNWKADNADALYLPSVKNKGGQVEN